MMINKNMSLTAFSTTREEHRFNHQKGARLSRCRHSEKGKHNEKHL